MENIKFLTLEEVIFIQQVLIDMFGGLHGIRDKGLLDSALHQPKASFSNIQVHENLFSMAAAYLFHIIKNHPFVDGNKRTGATSAITFLRLNNVELNITNDELYTLSLNVAQGLMGKSDITIFLKTISIKESSD